MASRNCPGETSRTNAHPARPAWSRLMMKPISRLHTCTYKCTRVSSLPFPAISTSISCHGLLMSFKCSGSILLRTVGYKTLLGTRARLWRVVCRKTSTSAAYNGHHNHTRVSFERIHVLVERSCRGGNMRIRDKVGKSHLR